MEKKPSSRTSNKVTSSTDSPSKAKTTRKRTTKTSSSKSTSTNSRNKTKKLDNKTFLLHSSKGKKRNKCKRVSVSPWIIFAAVAAAIIIFIGKPMKDHFVSVEGIEKGAEIPSKIKGEYYIDISHHNDAKGVQWDSLMVMADAKGRTIQELSAAKNIYPLSGVIIKATEGSNFKDKLFRQYWKEVGKSELKRGAYHFYRSSKNPSTQARNFINTVGELRHIDLPPILDIETIHKGCSIEDLNKGIRTWLQIVEEKYGKTPIIYTYDSFAKDYIDKDILEAYPVWIAHYKTDKPVIEKWDMWQFTDQALVYGFPTPVDLSVVKIEK